MLRPHIPAALLSLGACAYPAPPPLLSPTIRPDLDVRPAQRPQHQTEGREAVVRRARAVLGGAPLVVAGFEFTDDPVGCVRAAFWEAEIELFNAEVASDPRAGALEILFRSAAAQRWLHRETPRAGDVVFFDADRRGTALYPAQVAVVESVGSDGTIRSIGCFAGGPRRITLNLRTPDSEALNDRLADGENAARLFRSFANPWGSDS